MSRRATGLLRTALSTLYYSGASELLRPITRGRGVIYMLHSVSPEPRQAFEPSGILRVTPDFVETVVRLTRKAGFDFISLDEVPQRLADADAPPFAVMTLDDGYIDNRDYAYPIFRKHGVPFTIYMPSAFADGEGELWWFALEGAIRNLERVVIELDGRERVFKTETLAQKEAAYHTIYWRLRRQCEHKTRDVVAVLARSAGVDPAEPGRRMILSWDELRAMQADPLMSVGAHTVGHYAVARLDAETARTEIVEGARRIEQELDRPCRHFSFPYGDDLAAGPRDFEIARAAGFLTAVTTQKGLLHASHVAALSALPRLSINGDFQRAHYLKALLSGAPFALSDMCAKWTSRPASA